MKKLVAISILAAMLLTIGAIAMADESTWTLLIKGSTSGNLLGSGVAQAGTKLGASDGYNSSGEDATVTFSAGSAGVGIWEPTWAAATPPLYGSDKRAPLTGADTKSWDIVFFLGTGYTGTDAKLVWYGTTSADIMPTIAGVTYNYTMEVIADPTGTYAAGTKFAIDAANNASSSTAPLGSMAFNSAAVASLKMDATTALQSGVRLRFTAAPLQTPPVPEPSSMLALASGLVGLAGFAMRRRA